MNVFTFIFLVVLTGCSIPLLKIYLDYRRTRDHESFVPSGDGAEHRLAELESRIQVLEEIVTDKRYDLSREIDALESRPSATVSTLPGTRAAN